METGAVIDPILPGSIQPDTGGTIVSYAGGVVVGPLPERVGDRVNFTRNVALPDFASMVELIGPAVIFVAAPAPEASKTTRRKPRAKRKPKAKPAQE